MVEVFNKSHIPTAIKFNVIFYVVMLVVIVLLGQQDKIIDTFSQPRNMVSAGITFVVNVLILTVLISIWRSR